MVKQLDGGIVRLKKGLRLGGSYRKYSVVGMIYEMSSYCRLQRKRFSQKKVASNLELSS